MIINLFLVFLCGLCVLCGSNLVSFVNHGAVIPAKAGIQNVLVNPKIYRCVFFIMIFLLFYRFLGAAPERNFDGTIPLLETSGTENSEKTGTILSERVRRGFRRIMGDRVLVLQTPQESFTLLRGRNKLVVQEIEKFIGREISVQGVLVPANKRFPRRGIKVMSFTDKPAAPSALSITGNLEEQDVFSMPPIKEKQKETTATSTK